MYIYTLYVYVYKYLNKCIYIYIKIASSQLSFRSPVGRIK